MTKSKTRSHRESRKAQQELPKVPDLGRLAMPRKGDRAAAKYVASVGSLCDRRRADRKARKNALAYQDAVSANPRHQHLDKIVREQMLTAMAGWSFDHEAKAFVAIDTAPERFEELLDAVIDLGPSKVVLRVSGLSSIEGAKLRVYLRGGSTLVMINARLG